MQVYRCLQEIYKIVANLYNNLTRSTNKSYSSVLEIDISIIFYVDFALLQFIISSYLEFRLLPCAAVLIEYSIVSSSLSYFVDIIVLYLFSEVVIY